MVAQDHGRPPRILRRFSVLHSAWGCRRAVAVALFLGVALACGTPRGLQPREIPASASEEWYASNGPLLAEYLKTLPASGIGKPLKGIRLAGNANDSRWLEGQTYLGIPSGLPDGVEVRLVDDGTRAVAYLWVMSGAEPYVLEACASGEQEGIRARRAGGGVHAWTKLEAAHGVVYTGCPPDAWIPAFAPSRQPEPPVPGSR